MNTTPPVASPSIAGVPPALPPARLQGLLSASLPRTVGYGLFALFGLDLVQLAADYARAPFEPQSDAQLCAQLIERAGVLLVAYALVFMETRTSPSRASRAARKTLSWAALFSVAGFLALATLSAVSGVRLYRANVAALTQQRTTRLDQFNQVEARLPKLPPAQLLQILAELSPATRPRLATMTPEQATTELKKALPALRKETEAQFGAGQQRAKREQIIFSGKYCLGGIGLAVIMLLIAESTRPARQERVFARAGDAPSLKLEDSVARGFGRAFHSMERLGDLLLPDFSGFQWYRKLRRKFRRDKK